MSVAIPKRLGHIWIGPKPAPDLWMNTWPEKHPDWEYTVYDNDFLTGFPFRLRHLINEYWWRGLYAGVQDMMRYEILFAYGGFMADADAICLHPVDELLDKPRAYTVYDRPEDDPFRGVCPILACEPGNPFVGAIINRLAEQSPATLRKAEVSTGNRFLMRMIRELSPTPEQLKIWPTHYFIPWQKSNPAEHYSGPDRVYAEQQWATSFYAYNKEGGPNSITYSADDLSARRDAITERLVGGQGRRHAPHSFLDRQLANDVGASRDRLRKDLENPQLNDEIRLLNLEIETCMTKAGKPAKFHGMHFYRHMQENPLSQSPLRSRSINSRTALLSWMSQAKNALVVGFDTGHLLLSALHLFPTLRITAVEGGYWPIEKDEHPPLKHIYTPAAARWLNSRFSDRLDARVENEQKFLREFSRVSEDKFDMVIFPTLSIGSLNSFMYARPHLTSHPLAVFGSPEDDLGYTHADRILLQGIGWLPVERRSFGPSRGSISVLRLDRDAAQSHRVV